MKTAGKLSYWQKRHIEHVKNHLAKAVMDFGMISDGDNVLAAVSGGKDSLVMLDALSAFRQFKKVSFHLESIHITVEDVPYKANHNLLHQLTENMEIPLHFVTIKAGIENRGKKAPCFVCSWHRRKALFEFADEHDFQRLALGHHRDDAVETLLLNMAYHGHISSLPGKLSMFDGKLDIIRPLLLLTDKDTQEYADIRQFPRLLNECPFADHTKRNTARKLLEALSEIHPKAAGNIFNAMQQIDEEYLPKKQKK